MFVTTLCYRELASEAEVQNDGPSTTTFARRDAPTARTSGVAGRAGEPSSSHPQGFTFPCLHPNRCTL